MRAEERDGVRLQEQDHPAQHQPAQSEGEAAERHHLGDLERGQTPMRVKPVAHRRPRHRGESQVVRQRVGAERRKGNPAVADLVPGVDGGEPVVEGQHPVGQHRPAERDQQRAVGDGGQGRLDVRDLEVAELLPHHPDRADQQRHAQQRRQLPERLFQQGHAQCASDAGTAACRAGLGRAADAAPSVASKRLRISATVSATP